jgi:hypothetical protein
VVVAVVMIKAIRVVQVVLEEEVLVVLVGMERLVRQIQVAVAVGVAQLNYLPLLLVVRVVQG